MDRWMNGKNMVAGWEKKKNVDGKKDSVDGLKAIYYRCCGWTDRWIERKMLWMDRWKERCCGWTDG